MHLISEFFFQNFTLCIQVSAERRRSGLGGYSPYFGMNRISYAKVNMKIFFFVIESSPIGRRVPLRSQQRNDDIYYSNTTPTSYIEHGLFDKYKISIDILF